LENLTRTAEWRNPKRKPLNDQGHAIENVEFEYIGIHILKCNNFKEAAENYFFDGVTTRVRLFALSFAALRYTKGCRCHPSRNRNSISTP
jgi:hypothetical protein